MTNLQELTKQESGVIIFEVNNAQGGLETSYAIITNWLNDEYPEFEAIETYRVDNCEEMLQGIGDITDANNGLASGELKTPGTVYKCRRVDSECDSTKRDFVVIAPDEWA